jgi:hypothetical protein
MGLARARPIIPYRLPIPPFSPLDLPDCLSWWDAFDATQRTLGGVGGVQLVTLGDKGPASVPLNCVGAPTNGVPMGTWEIDGEVVPLPGPVEIAPPRRSLEGSTTMTVGDLTVVALIPLGAVATDAYYWSYGHSVSPTTRIALAVSTSPGGRVRLVLGSIVGNSTQVSTPTSMFAGTAGPAAHAFVVARLDQGSGTADVECWYDLDTGAGVQVATPGSSSGYVGASVTVATFGGRAATPVDAWQGLDARLHTVTTYARVLTDPEVEQLRAWAFDRLGWTP